MRIEIGGAQLTEGLIEVLDTLQNNSEVSRMYVETLDRLCRWILLDLDVADEESDAEILGTLRVLQMIRRDIDRLSNPPGVDDPENDIPVAQL